MLLTTVFLVVMLVFILYESMGAWAYRQPRVLLVYGLSVSGLSVWVKGNPLMLKSIRNLPWSAEELDLAASVVDPTLIGLAGGLIASAFILKLQILQAQDLLDAEGAHARALERSKGADRADEDLTLIAESLPADELLARRKRIQLRKMDALDEIYKAEKKLHALRVPGLGDVSNATHPKGRN